jgi:hypothetical protein
MLKYNDPNPLSVFGLRRVDHCPPHFTKILFDTYAQEKAFTDWIYSHLSGRFFYGDWFVESATPGGKSAMTRCVAFEEPGEASMFSLIMDTINKQPLW